MATAMYRKSLFLCAALAGCAGQQVPMPEFPEGGIEFGGPTVSMGRPTMVNCPYVRPDGTHATFETEARLCNDLLDQRGGGAGAVVPLPESSPASSPAPNSPLGGSEAALRQPLLQGSARVANQLYEDEGYQHLPYILEDVCHIGMGRTIDREDCIAVDVARAEVRRIVSDVAWDSISQVRVDALTVLCYWSACAGYVELWGYAERGMWWSAALEVIEDSAIYDIDPGRAIELMETIGLDEWRFTSSVAPRPLQ